MTEPETSSTEPRYYDDHYAYQQWLFVVHHYKKALNGDVPLGEVLPTLVTTGEVRKILGERFPDESLTDEDVRQALRVTVMHGLLDEYSIPDAIEAAIRRILEPVEDDDLLF